MIFPPDGSNTTIPVEHPTATKPVTSDIFNVRTGVDGKIHKILGLGLNNVVSHNEDVCILIDS